MKYTPIIFNSEMVRAILEGRKTQMRRPVKPQPQFAGWGAIEWKGRCGDPEAFTSMCPFGTVGDRLWVRETWAGPFNNANSIARYRYKADNSTGYKGSWRPSIHMPRWASRITLEITNVRVERVQDISDDDALAEFGLPIACPRYNPEHSGAEPYEVYKELWNRLYGTWDANPWVWAIEFKRINIGEL